MIDGLREPTRFTQGNYWASPARAFDWLTRECPAILDRWNRDVDAWWREMPYVRQALAVRDAAVRAFLGMKRNPVKITSFLGNRHESSVD